MRIIYGKIFALIEKEALTFVVISELPFLNKNYGILSYYDFLKN